MKIAYHLPKGIFSNADFESLGWSSEKIFKKTGITERHICAPDEFALDLAQHACTRLFEENGIQPADVDFLLYCTQSPDFIIPNNASILQDRIGLRESVGAMDINLGCSGFVYGLSLAKGLLSTGQSKSVLLVTAETYSKYINEKDRANRVIFGDGAAATWLDLNDAKKIGEFVFGTDGRGAENLCVRTSGLRFPRTPQSARESVDRSGNVRSEDNLFMNGPEIFSFTIERVPAAVKELLEKSRLKFDEIDLFVFHQANAYMLEALRERIGIEQERFFVHLEKVGNTVSSTIPIALCEAYRIKRIKPNQRVMLVAFGVGYSWAATILNT